MERYLTSVALVLALLFSPAAASGGDEPRKPHNECKDFYGNPPGDLTPKQVETYVDIIKESFQEPSYDKANRLEAANTLGLWFTKCLDKGNSSQFGVEDAASCNLCKNGCHPGGVWNYACVAACIYSGKCP